MMARWTHTLVSALALSLMAGTTSAHFESGQVWIVDQLNHRLYFVNPATWNVNISLDSTDGLSGPAAMGFSLHGEMLIGNFASNSVWELNENLVSSTVLTSTDGLGGPFGGNGIVIGPGDGDVYITNFNTTEVMRYDHDYQNGVVFADASDNLVAPGAMAFLANGELLIADRGAGRGLVHKADAAGNVSVWYVPPENEYPIAIAVRTNYDVFVLMTSGNIYRLIGGDPANAVLLASVGVPALRGSLAFSPDYSALYHVNQAEGLLRTVDPVTGVHSVLATLPSGGGGTSMIVTGTQHAPGTFIEFGDPLVGSGEFEPRLEGVGDLRLGQPFTLEARDFLGGTQIFFFIGVGSDEQTFLGGEFHIDTSTFYKLLVRTASGPAGVPGAGSFDFNFGVPNDPSLVYVRLYSQILGTDAGAIQGASFTPCLELYIGE